MANEFAKLFNLKDHQIVLIDNGPGDDAEDGTEVIDFFVFARIDGLTVQLTVPIPDENREKFFNEFDEARAELMLVAFNKLLGKVNEQT